MSQATTVKEVLQAVEWMLTNVGWCRGSYYRDEEYRPIINPQHERPASMCLRGAVNLVETTNQLRMEAIELLFKANDRMDIIHFNDSICTTKDEVLGLVRKAIGAAH